MQNKVTKKAGAFRTISEVADQFNVEQHVLRFWETKFSQIKPLKRAGGRRYYRPEDIAVIERIHDLLYNQKYTIKGAQSVLKGNTRNQIAEASNGNKPSLGKLTDKQVSLLKATLGQLKDIRSQL
jgi:DNA-binding transcriptional MerR regulator